MAKQTPEQFIKSLQGSGVLLVRNGVTYFIPLKTVSECILPKAFQADAPEISTAFFEFEKASRGKPAAQNFPVGQVAKKLDELLSEFRVADGVSQAIWIGMAEEEKGSLVSKAEGSKQVLFRYRRDKKRIVVDISKGGRPSNH